MTTSALVLQCGGPTAVVNASLLGVIKASDTEPSVARLWGARLGLRGLATGDWAELTGRGHPALAFQPGAALGSGRYQMTDEDVALSLGLLRARGVGRAFVIGGNGAQTAALRLSREARAANLELQVIGIPKTIDNDLAGTDVCPGYGSAARFIAESTHDVGLDLYAMRDFDDVAVVEVMGRHAGWLAAAAALGRRDASAPPPLILAPEVQLDEDGFLEAVRRRHARDGVCLVIAAEGVRDGAGDYLAEKFRPGEWDGSGQRLLSLAGGTAPYLAGLIRARLGLRCREARPDTIQRGSRAHASEVDRALAGRAGEAAVRAAAGGESEVMIGLRRRAGEWVCERVPLALVVGRERRLPAEFFDAAELTATPAFLDYARPLIGRWSPKATLF